MEDGVESNRGTPEELVYVRGKLISSFVEVGFPQRLAKPRLEPLPLTETVSLLI
jgi:hypothetical protein